MYATATASNMPHGFSHRPELASAATPEDLKGAPRHRWFYFPHSYSYRLVDTILAHWQFSSGGVVADNFVGAGTTLLAGWVPARAIEPTDQLRVGTGTSP